MTSQPPGGTVFFNHARGRAMMYPPSVPQFVNRDDDALEGLLEVEDALWAALAHLGPLSTSESLDTYFLRRRLEEALERLNEVRAGLKSVSPSE
jgi:hypothetical protein